MAKRIKIKGKAPRGLSKAQRIVLDESKKLSANPFTLTRDLNKNWSNTRQKMESAGKDVSSRPSSARKKLVKEGSRKFIGPRPLKEFDPYEEIDSPDESEHRLSRGYTKSQRRSDEAEFLRGLPQNQKLSRAEQNMLKGDIARSATSKEGKLLNKLLSALRAQELAKYREIPF